jgi:chromate transporter
MTDVLVMAWTFLWLSLLCVGGGVGVIPEMHRQVVAHHHWVTSREFVDGYTLAQLTPGPNMLIAAFVGYRAHGVPGALVATVAMFLPTSALAMFVADRWQRWRAHRWAEAIEHALAPVGMGLMAAGVYTLAQSALHDVLTVALALGTAAALTLRWLPPMLVIIVAGVAGWLLGA